MQGRNAQVARIYRILNILEGAPQGLSVSEIRQRLIDRDFEVSKRTIYRDLEALSDAGFPVYQDEQNWVLERSKKVGQYLALDGSELLALHLARGMLSPFFEPAFKTIAAKLGSHQKEHFEELSAEVQFEPAQTWGQELDLDMLETIRAACAEGHVLSVDYESVHSGTKSRRRLGPNYLYFGRGSVYLIAEDLATRETKIFALPRMKNAVMEPDAYEGQPVDHEKFFQASFGIFHGTKPSMVRVRFSKSVARFVQERRWHLSQRIENLPDGAIEISMKVAVTPELVQWILGFGPEAQVLESEDLRSRVSDSIGKMSELYKSQPNQPTSSNGA